jgi:hypothetical protein
MPLKPEDQQRRNRLIRAAQVLASETVGQPELAAEIDYVLSPKGPGFVKRLYDDARGVGRTKQPTLPIRMPKDRRDLINHLADTQRVVLTEIVENGFRRWIEGDFVLNMEGRAFPDSTTESVVLTVTPHQVLRDEVKKKCAAMKKANMFRPGRSIFETTVAAHALYEHFNIGPYASGREPVDREPVQIIVRHDHCAAFDSAGLAGNQLTSIVEDGVRRFMDGSLDFRAEPRPVGEKGKIAPPGKHVKLWVDSELLAEAEKWFEKVSAERGLPGYMGTGTFVSAALFAHLEIGPYAPDRAAGAE